jgi:UDP-N-acetylmuramate--alanine ligase
MIDYYFVGIGGVGMSALAGLMIDRGYKVAGSDLADNDLIRGLRLKGAEVCAGHREGRISPGTGTVVVSSCIPSDNPEVMEAVRLGVPVIGRGELLRRVIDGKKRSVGITGTHGKTTTTALAAAMMEKASLAPDVLVGGETSEFGGNYSRGQGDIIVAEIDESDGYFRNISVGTGVLTNVEREHLENYGTMKELIAAYEAFIYNISLKGGTLVVNGEDPAVSRLKTPNGIDLFTFGFSDSNDMYCRNASYGRMIEAELFLRGEFLTILKSPMMGRYNLLNILAAAAAAHVNGCNAEAISEAAEFFSGVKRRFQKLGDFGGVELIEDYAHHPTEVKAVLETAKSYSRGRVIAVFQPHRYSRLRDLIEDFSGCFSDCDILLLTDVYSAHEKDTSGVDPLTLYERIKEREGAPEVIYADKEQIPGFVSSIVSVSDTVLVLGAGDINRLCPAIGTGLRGRPREEKKIVN